MDKLYCVCHLDEFYSEKSDILFATSNRKQAKDYCMWLQCNSRHGDSYDIIETVSTSEPPIPVWKAVFYDDDRNVPSCQKRQDIFDLSEDYKSEFTIGKVEEIQLTKSIIEYVVYVESWDREEAHNKAILALCDYKQSKDEITYTESKGEINYGSIQLPKGFTI